MAPREGNTSPSTVRKRSRAMISVSSILSCTKRKPILQIKEKNLTKLLKNFTDGFADDDVHAFGQLQVLYSSLYDCDSVRETVALHQNLSNLGRLARIYCIHSSRSGLDSEEGEDTRARPHIKHYFVLE